MPYLIAVGALLIVVYMIYMTGKRRGYKEGRLDERKEWSTKIREIEK